MQVTQDIVLPVLLAAILANTALLILVVVASRNRRGRRTRSGGDPVIAGSMMSSSFADGYAESTWGSGGIGAPDDDATAPDADLVSEPAGAIDDDEVGGEAEPAAGDDPPAGATEELAADIDATATPGLDAVTGLLDQVAFQHLILDEDLRVQRYHRPVTVVLFEVDGLDRITERLGTDATDRVVAALADTIRRLARKADHVARVTPGRFAILLSETDEIAAINYVERVRRACELWLESGAITLRLAAGWAGTTGDPTLPETTRLATDRMYVELRRQVRRPE